MHACEHWAKPAQFCPHAKISVWHAPSAHCPHACGSKPPVLALELDALVDGPVPETALLWLLLLELTVAPPCPPAPP
jgi:hypothetical protein